MEYFSVVVLHIEAVQRLDPAAQQALLRDQLHVSDLVLPTYLFLLFFFFFFISMSQLWKGLEHILMQFCLSVSRLFKLFIFWGIAFTELCSNSNRIIYYDKWHCEIVLFLQIVFFSLCFILCLCLSSPPQQQHCMWLMKGCFENSLSSSVNWPDCQEVGV